MFNFLLLLFSCLHAPNRREVCLKFPVCIIRSGSVTKHDDEEEGDDNDEEEGDDNDDDDEDDNDDEDEDDNDDEDGYEDDNGDDNDDCGVGGYH